LHHGRAEYTLITPGNPPVIEKKVLGTNAAAGEVMQLLVGTGIWKKSSLLPADLEMAKTQDEKDHTGCLITEIVVPGFHWEDHEFLTLEGLQGMFKGVGGGEEAIKEFTPFVKST
jgi:predicted cupin superfamily sugar epimerase